MAKGNEVEITGEVDGEISVELKHDYARYLAKVLLAEYGKKNCEKILQGLRQ